MALGLTAPRPQAPIRAIDFVDTNMDGAWVGTWRFHHPCGHVMAEFTTLGFTYTIPEMTGKSGIMEDGAWAEGERNSWGITAHLLLPLNKPCKFSTLQGAKHAIPDSCSAGTQHYIHPCITMNAKLSSSTAHLWLYQ